MSDESVKAANDPAVTPSPTPVDKQVASLQSIVTTLQASQATNATTTSTLQSIVTTLQAELTAALATIATYAAKLTAFEAAISKVEAEVQTVVTAVESGGSSLLNFFETLGSANQVATSDPVWAGKLDKVVAMAKTIASQPATKP